MKKPSAIMLILTVFFIIIVTGIFIGRITMDGFIHVHTSSSMQSEREYNDADSYSGKININTADIDTLQELPGIGEKTAKEIVKYRDRKGMFQSIRDIKKVEGIGDKTYEEIKDFITVIED